MLIFATASRTFSWGEVFPLIFGLAMMAVFIGVALFAMRKHPAGLKPLFMTEMWERFSYYGMRALLVLYMTASPEAGGLGFDPGKATMIYGTYGMGVYLLSLPGGWVADRFLGYRKAVFLGGVILALGHLALAFSPLTFFYGGMVLIIVGTGLLKTNCTSLVGMLYPEGDKRRDAGYSVYYMGINLGAFISPLICGFLGQSQTFLWMLDRVGIQSDHGWHWGFAAAGVAMVIGLVQFKLQQHKLGDAGLKTGEAVEMAEHQEEVELMAHPEEAGKHRPKAMLIFGILGCAILSFAMYGLIPNPIYYAVPPLAALLGAAFGWANWNYVVLTPEESKRVWAVGLLFGFSMLFWAIFEQAGTTLNLYAENHTDRTLPGGGPFPASYYQSVNSLFIIALAPAFSWLWLKLGSREPSSPTKFVIGVLAAGAGFLILVPTMGIIAGGGKVSAWWLVATYFIHTVGELCLSPVGLSTTSKLAPAKFAGLMMGVWFLSISFGYKLGGFAGHLVEKFSLGTYFMACFVLTLFGALLLVFLTPTIKRFMGATR